MFTRSTSRDCRQSPLQRNRTIWWLPDNEVRPRHFSFNLFPRHGFTSGRYCSHHSCMYIHRPLSCLCTLCLYPGVVTGSRFMVVVLLVCTLLLCKAHPLIAAIVNCANSSSDVASIRLFVFCCARHSAETSKAAVEDCICVFLGEGNSLLS